MEEDGQWNADSLINNGGLNRENQLRIQYSAIGVYSDISGNAVNGLMSFQHGWQWIVFICRSWKDVWWSAAYNFQHHKSVYKHL